jgi:Zn-dependent M28 family amino/carboxypeptidase
MNNQARLCRLPAMLTLVAVCACSPKESGVTAPPAPPASATTKAQPESAAATSATNAAPFTPEAVAAADAMSGPQIGEWIRTLSSDEYEGRAPGKPGDEKARKYIAGELEKLGYAPGGADGSWDQPVELVGITSKIPSSWTFSKDASKMVAKAGDEYIGASGVQAETSTIKDAEVVFVGYGIQAPEFQWDDFKGADLKGKVLLMLNNDPDWDPALFAGVTRLYYGRWTYKYESAARQGAAGAIIIHTTPSAGYPWQVVQSSWSGEQFEVPAGDEPRIQIQAWLTEDKARELAKLAGKDLDQLREAAKSRDFAPVPLGVKTSLSFPNTLASTRTANVAGLLKGSDPQLASEVVIYSAHHDHLGIGVPDAEADTIYNGARDNASGVAMLLGIAKSFKALPQPPRRSILMLFVAAEEQGLIGSEYYAQHPTFAPGRIAANINFDSGGIWGETSDVTYIGMGKSSLDAVVRQGVDYQRRVLKGDEFPDRGSFYRSDQFSLARIGVPAIYLDPGVDVIGKPEGWGRAQQEDYTAKHYHQPSDEYDESWNLDGLVQDARLGFWCGVIIANADQMPTWNPGDEFEAARREALQAVR